MSPDRTPSLPARFARDERGAILILWALFLAVAFGFLALAFDLGRLATTQTQLQSFADQVALAAAGELDGRPGARDRARAAAENLVAGQQTFGQGSQALGSDDFDIIFLSTLPASDNVPATSEATSDASARYVRVVVDQRTVLTPFAHVAATLTGNSRISADVGAEATAGFTSYACDITPLFFCVPNAGWRAEDNVGKQIEVVSGSKGGGAWTPGNFGFLDVLALPPDPTGPCSAVKGRANDYRCRVAAERAISQCIETSAPLKTLTGQAEGLTEFFNARFDIYKKGGGKDDYSKDEDFRPAPNVLSDLWTASSGGGTGGGSGGSGGGKPPAPPVPPNLPRDSCIASSSCSFGTGDWDPAPYLSEYHGGNWPTGGLPPASFTRFDLYKAEIQAARAGGGDRGMLTAPGYEDMGRPGNHDYAKTAVQRALLDPERRIVVAAAVECGGQDMNGKSSVTAIEYVRLFMTEPVRGSGSDSRILAEIVGTAGGIGSGAVEASYRDFIQLYR